jgi:sulfatase modifying factor 1
MNRSLLGTCVILAAGTIVLGAEGAPPQRTATSAILAPPHVEESPVVDASCPDGMILVDGDFCSFVVQACEHFVDNQANRDRCESYRASSPCLGGAKHERFCIDRYEFPNLKGIKPIAAVNWDEASAGCARVGKRLCSNDEWTLACEGPERLPYPYGYDRDSKACNIDRPYETPDNDKLNDPYKRAIEMQRLDRREESGAREGCVSGYGVHDMTGNVDEWVSNPKGKVDDKPYRSGLKGGWWGPVRNRCRPMTTDHNEWHQGPAIGYRCCSAAR